MKLSNFRYRPLITIGQYIILIIAALIILYPIWSAFNISMMSDSKWAPIRRSNSHRAFV